MLYEIYFKSIITCFFKKIIFFINVPESASPLLVAQAVGRNPKIDFLVSPAQAVGRDPKLDSLVSLAQAV